MYSFNLLVILLLIVNLVFSAKNFRQRRNNSSCAKDGGMALALPPVDFGS